MLDILDPWGQEWGPGVSTTSTPGLAIYKPVWPPFSTANHLCTASSASADLNCDFFFNQSVKVSIIQILHLKHTFNLPKNTTFFDYLQDLPMGKENFIRQIENSFEFKLLDKVVKEEVTAQDAVQDVINMTMSALSIHGPNKLGGIGLPDYNVSLAVMELANRLEPSKQTKLVEFISHLQKQVAVDPSTNEPLRVQGDTLWTDMPSFGYTELETWYEFGGDYKDPCDAMLDSKQRDRWANLNAFLAQLTQAADIHYRPPKEEVQFCPLDKSLRAIWTMAMALENERPPASLEDTAAMEAACQWFIYAAERLWANVLNNRTYPEAAGAGPGKRYEEEGWPGYTRERWGIWEDGLREARAACEDERMWKLIDDALASLRRGMVDD
ncbi:unnamed protein product [Penicillium egyptiacum]|uniref:Uncharacterized protein n=1 Tax=Penicillium egyptiacum TaxID=1303716 RepID=A0A9W4KC02_9EURO|nr:unnamed protein product [Penicillium egyptiacum]